MQWTELLTQMMKESFSVADGLMELVNDDELDWKPATGKNWMTTGQLLQHMTGSCGACCRGFDTGDWGMPSGECEADSVDSVAGAEADSGTPTDQHESMLPPAEALPTVSSVAEARKILAEDRAIAFEVVAKAGEERLEGEMSAAPWEPDNSRSLGLHCLNMVQHLDSHRHQLFYYLKLMGKDVNTMNLWGM
jgi:hypothetical protein